MDINAVNDSLSFALRRLDELKRINNGNISSAQPQERQILIQEFFFHLVSAIDKLAQVINQSRTLNIPINQVSYPQICRRLRQTDPIRPLIALLHPETQHNRQWVPLPQNPYSEESSHFRILVFRHWVNHTGVNPFHFRWGAEPNTSLVLDPRDRSLGASKLAAMDELESFWNLVNDKCEQVIGILSSIGVI